MPSHGVFAGFFAAPDRTQLANGVYADLLGDLSQDKAVSLTADLLGDLSQDKAVSLTADLLIA